MGQGDGDGMGFDMSSMPNQPPQIFGARNPDGSPIAPSLPGPVFSDDLLSGNLDESNEAKRRRIARVRLADIPCVDGDRRWTMAYNRVV